MALADLAAYFTARDFPQQIIEVAKLFSVVAGTGWCSSWLGTGFPAAGTAPSGSSTVPTRTTTGALGQLDASAGELRAMCRTVTVSANTGGQAGLILMLIDRLVHKGGLDGTLNTAQTVSTAALTRYTDGVGVRAGIEIYSSIGATGTTATIDYTDSTGTASQTSPAIVVGGTGFNVTNRFLPISLGGTDGGKGIKAVNTVTLAASTATAGNFGITLYKPLMKIAVQSGGGLFAPNADPIGTRGFLMPVISTSACLQWLLFGAGTVTEQICGAFRFFED